MRGADRVSVVGARIISLRQFMEMQDAWVQHLLALEREVFKIVPYADYPWEEHHFRAERPRKWELSQVALVDGQVIGFWIASQLFSHCTHSHRVVVHLQFWGTGAAKAMHEAYVQAALALPTVTEMTLTVHVQSLRALRFYRKCGYHILTGPELERYCERRSCQDKVEGDRLTDASGFQRYVLRRLITK